MGKQNKLMVLGGYDDTVKHSNKIYVCHIGDGGNAVEWNEYERALPYHNRNVFEAIVVFDTILIVMYFGDKNKENDMKEIWCLDLLSDKWEKSKIQSPCEKCMHLIKASGNYLHAISFSESKHVKIKISDIIPAAFYESYSK